MPVLPQMELKGKKNQLLVKNSTLSGGQAGNMQTLRTMNKLAHEKAGDPTVRKLALNILNFYDVPSHHFADEAIAIGKFVQENVRYVKDPTGIEQVHDPVMLIEQISRGIARGDCDDMALLTASLLLSIGHTPVFRCVRYEADSGPFNHIYVVDYAKNKAKKHRVVIDCIIKDKPIGYEVKHKSGQEYAI